MNFPTLIRLLKLYTLVAFFQPFPMAYWTDAAWIDLFALFFFPIAANHLEESKTASVAAWLFGVTLMYTLGSCWYLIILLSHLMGMTDAANGSVSAFILAGLSLLYTAFAYYGFRLVRSLQNLLRSTKIEPGHLEDQGEPPPESEPIPALPPSSPSP